MSTKAFFISLSNYINNTFSESKMRFGLKVAYLAHFAVFFYLPGVLADPSSYGSSCRAAVGNYNIDCGELDYYPCRCLSDIFMSSTMKCLNGLVGNDTTQVEQGMKTFIYYCAEYGDVIVTFDEIEANYEVDVKANNFTRTQDLKNATAYLTTPIVLTSEEIQVAIHTINTFSWNEYSGTLFG